MEGILNVLIYSVLKLTKDNHYLSQIRHNCTTFIAVIELLVLTSCMFHGLFKNAVPCKSICYMASKGE
jgi:hypothetical protein